ncbi:hypothetical protein [Nocardioides coralli]|uniref:hypothetical protein n=1 Tax=Nocardioides coralli TaxID=2872154 RepID=UPI001CA4082F|nr:hypothetical protein [Nocardioides coralli]QZY28002.1 hypothetical protein K6T13_10895 [Nocardioides coralli]
MSGTEDDAWRAIVENYGERPQVDDDDLPASEPEPEPFAPTDDDLDRPDPADRFVPPVPPPGPRLRLPQHLPWIGVFGAPAVLLLALLTGIDLPGWAGYGLVTAFVGGFLWLVLTMRRGGRDPWDDGARV